MRIRQLTKKTKKRLLIVAVVCAGVWWYRCTPMPYWLHLRRVGSDVPVFDTPPRLVWSPSSPSFLDLRVRCEGDDGSSILVTRAKTWEDVPEVPNLWPVCRYERDGRLLTRVSPTVWAQASGVITEPFGRRERFSGLVCKQVDGILKYSMPGEPFREFNTRGSYCVTRSMSRDGKFIAVLAADGPKRLQTGRSMLFGSIGGGYYGQHYVEIFRISEMKRVGKATRIPFTTVEGIDSACWSADGRFIVYANQDGTKMCVIHVEQEDETP